MGMTDADGKEFYKNANNGAGGYYDVSKEAYAANCQKAVEVLTKYYNLTIAQ